MGTLGQDVPLHDADGGVVLVAVTDRAPWMDQVPMGPGRTPLQNLFALTEQLVWIHLDRILIRVLIWALLEVRVGLGQGGTVQRWGHGTKQPAAAAAHSATWWRGQAGSEPVRGPIWANKLMGQILQN